MCSKFLYPVFNSYFCLSCHFNRKHTQVIAYIWPKIYCVGKWARSMESTLPVVVSSQYSFNSEVWAQLFIPGSAYCHSFFSTDEQFVMMTFKNPFVSQDSLVRLSQKLSPEVGWKSKKWKQNCMTEILEYFMLDPPLCDISSLGNILCFSLSGRLQQSWGQREPYSWWLTWVALLPVPAVLLPLCLTPKHLCKHNCFPLTSTFFRASLHETLRYAWRLANVSLSGDNWQQQLTAQLPQPTTCAGVF